MGKSLGAAVARPDWAAAGDARRADGNAGAVMVGGDGPPGAVTGGSGAIEEPPEKRDPVLAQPSAPASPQKLRFVFECGTGAASSRAPSSGGIDTRAPGGLQCRGKRIAAWMTSPPPG